MAWFDFLWTPETIEHLAEHGVSPEGFESVVLDPDAVGTSRSSGRPMAYGYTSDGRYIACVYEMIDDVTIYPVTAYEVDEQVQ